MSQPILSTTPNREFRDHTNAIRSVAVFPDGRRMVTGSLDKTLRLWDLKTGEVLKKMEGHRESVWRLAVSRDGKLIASGDESGELIAWHGETGEPLAQFTEAHSRRIITLDFSPDGTMLATGSADKMMKPWTTTTWLMGCSWQENPIMCSHWVRCVRYSPFGELLAVATEENIEIYNTSTRERIAYFKGHTQRNFSLAWTPDGTRLLSSGDEHDPTVREWDTSTWMQVGDSWEGHTSHINNIAISPTGTLVASASSDTHVRLWQFSDHQTIAIFQHSSWVACVTFSADSKDILSGGGDNMVSEWAVPKNIWPEEALEKPASKILIIDRTARNACIAADLPTVEELFNQEINTDANNYTSYTNRSLVMARKHDWDHALDDAIKSVTIQPSLLGYISKGIALCGKGQVRDARTAFDLAFMFTNADSQTIHVLLLVKAIAMFNADQHEEAMLLVQQLATACPNNDTLACRVVEAYLCVQLGINALNGARHDEAAAHFTAAINTNALSSQSDIYALYEDLVVLFWWDLNSLWEIANQKRCQALLRASRLGEAVESYRYMMDMSDEATKVSFLDWSAAFKEECITLCAAKGNTALTESDYDRAIELYSAAIDLDSTSDTLFANRCKARLGKRLSQEALLDAQKVIELNPSSYLGYNLKHAALHGAQRYDEAIQAFRIMLSKLDNTPDTQIRVLRQQYLRPSKAEHAIRRVIDSQLDNSPLRVLDTTTGLVCDHEVQISAFKTSTEYKELLSLTVRHANRRKERIQEVVGMYFRYAMLSHRWEGMEPRLQDIQGKVVYDLGPVGGITKLQSFCKTARDAGYRWAWSDTCCIDKNNHVELQESVNSMFVWYRDSALTIVYLSDVSPSSKPGALAKSAWNTRGWTVQEFLAPKVILFYQNDWTLYLDDRSPNHKDSVVIMQELEHATGIDRQAIVTFCPRMRDAREKLQWASTRVTTLQEDIAYSLSGVFGVCLRVNYGEKKQYALGRLLQEIVAQLGDITALDWVGKCSEFNSCLPADITSYRTPPCKLPSLSEDEIKSSVSLLQGTMDLELALGLYQTLDNLSAPRFAHRRLHLPCIVFPVIETGRRSSQDQDPYTYQVKAGGLYDLQITTQDDLILFSQARPLPTWQTILLVRPWSRHLLELPDSTDDMQSVEDRFLPAYPVHNSFPADNEPVYSESHLRALRLVVRLEQPFGAFLLARQSTGEFRRIASDYDIIAQVKDVASVHNTMDIRTLEIL